MGTGFDKIRNDPTEFATVTEDPELGALCWQNGADIDAELLRYDDLWNEALPVPRPPSPVPPDRTQERPPT